MSMQILFYVLCIFPGVVLILGSLFGFLASISLRNVAEADKEVTFVVGNTEPMLENKSDTDSYKHRPNDSVLRHDSEKKLEYCNGIEERNKLIQPMLENKSHTDSYRVRPNDSVLRHDSEKRLEYCNGIEERNKLIQPMLENKSHTDSYRVRPNDSVLRHDSEKRLEYCNGIEETNKLIQPASFQCNGFGNHDSIH